MKNEKIEHKDRPNILRNRMDAQKLKRNNVRKNKSLQYYNITKSGGRRRNDRGKEITDVDMAKVGDGNREEEISCYSEN